MPTFTPPKVKDNPPILPDSKGLERRLWRYFPNRPRYVLVFKLSDGTFVQDTATAENSNTNIPYPYNPWNPEAPYSTSYFVNYEVNPPVPTSVTVSQDPYVAKVYMNSCYVTAAEATDLTNAGYGACISWPQHHTTLDFTQKTVSAARLQRFLSLLLLCLHALKRLQLKRTPQ